MIDIWRNVLLLYYYIKINSYSKIVIGSINKKYILLLVACLIQIVYSIITILGRRFLDSNIDNTLINCLSGSIGQMLVKLYPLILKVSNEQKSSIKITKKKKVIHYFFLCLIFTLMTSLEFFTFRMKDGVSFDSSRVGLFQNNNYLTFCCEMVFLIFISAIFLKYKYFIHHKISSIILILIVYSKKKILNKRISYFTSIFNAINKDISRRSKIRILLS